MPRLVTIGVYGFTGDRFLAALRGADVRQLIDVRQRRGVRGHDYAWANSARLQAALADARIDYRHHKELAPTTEMRKELYREDAEAGVGIRTRKRLPGSYRTRYTREILDKADLEAIVDEMPARGAAALMCVEADPEACHRSLVAERIAERFGVRVKHLRP